MDPSTSIPRQQSSVSRALSTYNMPFWMPRFPWDASASEILSEEASEEIGQSTDSFRWMGFWRASASEILSEKASEDTISNPLYWLPIGQWNASASEILNEEALEESGQSTDGF